MLWRGGEELERFAASPWARADHLLTLTLTPIQSFGIWKGADPLDGKRETAAGGPILIVTHNRSRPRRLIPFLRGEPPVVGRLEQAEGRLWAEGFVDGIGSLDMGTLSIGLERGTQRPLPTGDGAHPEAIRAQRDGGWFAESWFGRFEVTAVIGSLPGFGPIRVG